MTGTIPQAWQEVAQVAIMKLGGTAEEFQALTESVDIGEPDYPFESVPNVAGGRIAKQSPQEDGEVTLELYPTDLGATTTPGGLFQQFAGGNITGTQALTTDTSWISGSNRDRDRYAVAVLWTDETTSDVSAFRAVNGAGKVGLRFYAKECRITSHKSEFTDGILKTTATFKFPAMNKSGTTKTHAWESTNAASTSALSAITYSAGL